MDLTKYYENRRRRRQGGFLGILGGIGSLLSGIGGIWGALSANSARNRAAGAEGSRLDALSEEINRILGDIAGQREDRTIAGDRWFELAQQFPGVYSNVAPQLATTTQGIADQFMLGNVGQFLTAMGMIDPEAQGMRRRQAALIDEMDPANLGQDELLSITRLAAPLLPSGTLDPTTGAVQGATTSPVSLYRNLISGQYQQRRADYLTASNTFTEQARNAAFRQQERAAPFFMQAIDHAFGTSAQVATAESELDLRDIEGQQRIAEIMIGGLSSPLAGFGGM